MTKKTVLTAAVISDTHGKLPAKLLKKIEAVDFIIHAGDFTSEDIMKELEKIAPVYAVRGNCDLGVLYTLPLTLFFERNDVSIAVVHRLHDLNLSSLPQTPRVVICGHTHVSIVTKRNGTLFVNPGSPNSPRGGSLASFCLLQLEKGKVKAKIVSV